MGRMHNGTFIHCMAVGMAAILLSLIPAGNAHSATVPDATSTGISDASLKLYFFQDYSTYDSLFMDNGRRLDEFVRQYGLTDPDGPRISVAGSASAEGPYIHNEDLSLRRATRICDILVNSYGIPSYRIDRDARGIDWDDLLQQVRTASGLSQREKHQVTDIITSVPEHTFGADGKLTDSRRKRLMDLNGGRTWTWMLDSIFYEQRYGMVTVSEPAGIAPAPRDTVYVREDHYYYHYDTVYVGKDAVVAGAVPVSTDKAYKSKYPKIAPDRKLIMAVRTNLLLPLMNVGVEVPIGNRWSVGADYYSPWLWRNIDVNRYCYELLFGTGEVRYWLGAGHRRGGDNHTNRLLGHSIGVFGGAGYYDLGKDWSGNQGEFLCGGIDYMFAIPVFKNRMHMEFEVGVGYMHANQRPYNVYTEGGLLFHDRVKGDNEINYFGPLKASVSFVLPIYVKQKKDRKE